MKQFFNQDIKDKNDSNFRYCSSWNPWIRRI